MTKDDLSHGTIIISEGEYHALCRPELDGKPAPMGLLVSVPAEDGPNAVSTIRAIDVAVLWTSIVCGAVQVLALGEPSSIDSVSGGSPFHAPAMGGKIASPRGLVRRVGHAAPCLDPA